MTRANTSVGNACRPRRGGEEGFTFLGLMLIVVIMGIALSAIGEVWYMAQKREKEQQLLFVGDQFRRAITQFYERPPNGPRRYPGSLEELLRDPRYPGVRRYLRKIYVDPMTGNTDWGLVKGPSGEILGVYSPSEDEPAKKSNFRHDDAKFEGKTKYSEWVFLSVPKRSPYPATILKKP